MNSKPKLKSFLEHWVGIYNNVSVEWIKGKSPTAVFLNDKDEVIRTEAIHDMNADEMTGWLYVRDFQMDMRNKFPTLPDKVGKFGNSRYEYFKCANPKEFAQEFAEKRGGHLLAIESKEEAAYIALDFLEGKASDAWLAAEGGEEWQWSAGELKGETFWKNGTAVDGKYAEWSRKPEGEKCAVMLVEVKESEEESEDKSEEKPEYGFIDVPCRGTSNLIIEWKDGGHEEL